MSDKEKITCQDCNAEFEIKYNSEEYSIYFCPMCASELFLEEDEEDE